MVPAVVQPPSYPLCICTTSDITAVPITTFQNPAWQTTNDHLANYVYISYVLYLQHKFHAVIQLRSSYYLRDSCDKVKLYFSKSSLQQSGLFSQIQAHVRVVKNRVHCIVYSNIAEEQLVHCCTKLQWQNRQRSPELQLQSYNYMQLQLATVSMTLSMSHVATQLRSLLYSVYVPAYLQL